MAVMTPRTVTLFSGARLRYREVLNETGDHVVASRKSLDVVRHALLDEIPDMESGMALDYATMALLWNALLEIWENS